MLGFDSLPDHRSPVWRRWFLSLVALITFCAVAKGQQPFTTDDADVTPKTGFHFELSNQFDLLQRSSFPNLRANTAEFELGYGLADGLEVGIAARWLTIFNASGSGPRRVSGISHSRLTVKYNFLKEREGSRLPAMAMTFSVGLPTGEGRRLGAGLSDFYFNGILQKSITQKTKLRLNGGVLSSRYPLTGPLELSTRSTVYTGAGSLIKQVTEKFNFGFEVTGVATRKRDRSKGQLQTLLGGNYALRQNLTFDFAVVAGRFAASPRAGVQLGMSVDF
jgi:hypothetical protein